MFVGKVYNKIIHQFYSRKKNKAYWVHCKNLFLKIKLKKKIIVKISWSSRKPLQMAGTARGTVTAMTGNAKFPTPKVTLAAMTTAATRTEVAWANRKNGATAKDELTLASNDLDSLLHTQGDYVSGIANGDEAIIHSAGFEAIGSNASAAKGVAPATPAAPVLTSKNGGAIKAKVDAVANADNYCFVLSVDGAINATINNGQINIDAGTKMAVLNSSKSSVEFTNLPALKPVSVVVVVSNSHGNSGFSAIATGATLP